MSIKQPITRQQFLRKFVASSGIKYEEAGKVYDAMVELFADAVTTGQKISVGRVLSIKPVKRKARQVHMGFRGTRKTIYLSDRITFKVCVYREFLRTHELHWTL